MILLVLAACQTRFEPEQVVARSLAGRASGAIDAAQLDTEPWSLHTEALLAPVTPEPEVALDRSLARDLHHVPEVALRDLFRLVRREIEARDASADLPSPALIDRAAATARLDSVPSKEVIVRLRASASKVGIPLPASILPEVDPSGAPPTSSPAP